MATEHFSWRELDRYGDRTPEAERNLLELAQNLEVLRREVGKPIAITFHGGYNGPKMDEARRKSAKDSGKKVSLRKSTSQHRKGMAADIVIKGVHPKTVAKIIWRLIDEGKMKQGGIGVYSGYTHYDVRGTKARWPRFGAWRND